MPRTVKPVAEALRRLAHPDEQDRLASAARSRSIPRNEDSALAMLRMFSGAIAATNRRSL